MTLKWIGTRTQENGAFNATGLGCAVTIDPVGTDLLTRGSLMIEVALRPTMQPINLLRYSVLAP
jgi:hypothetical protein